MTELINDLMTFEIKDDVLIARYVSDQAINGEVAKQMVKNRKELTDNKPMKMMVVFPKLTNMDKEGRDYLASDDANEGVLATATVTKSLLGRVIINFFFRLNMRDKQDYPRKLFTAEEDAFEWLKSLDL